MIVILSMNSCIQFICENSLSTKAWAILNRSLDWLFGMSCWYKIYVFLPSSKTRFRWIQESSSQKNVPPFGLDGVYISEPCPSYCGGHGDCVSGVCFCDLGYTGKSHICVCPVFVSNCFISVTSPMKYILNLFFLKSYWNLQPVYMRCRDNLRFWGT